jgi:hypothetical protein
MIALAFLEERTEFTGETFAIDVPDRDVRRLLCMIFVQLIIFSAVAGISIERGACLLV